MRSVVCWLISTIGVPGSCGLAQAQVTPFGPTPYVQFTDSPFASMSFGSFHLETFEDHLFNVPGVTASAGGVTSSAFGPSQHDSVDADDGTIDGSGLAGDSYFAASGVTGIRFNFSAAVLGSLPTSAGLVWTDGAFATAVTFTAFGPAGEVLLSTTVGGFADSSFDGGTAEDRFFGVSSNSGILAIAIGNAGGSSGIEIDHLQYGSAVPEPATHALWLSGLAALVAYRMRRVKKKSLAAATR